MSDFQFARVDWIHALWLVLALTLLVILGELRGLASLDRFLSRVMQARMVRRGSRKRRITAHLLTMTAMALLVAALMRPQWGATVQEAVRVDSQIMICLDVSNSMLAEDVAPNRLERAKVELESLLGLLSPGQQVGLIAFAGNAAVLCPMTTDFGFLRMVLAETDPTTVGLGGTRIGEALRKAVDGFGAVGDIQRLILLITDGEDHDSFPLEVAREAREKGIRIVAIGFGDEAGSKIEITDPRTGVRSFLKDAAGKPVVTRLDGELLRELAAETGGPYIPAGTGALDLESIYRSHIATLLSGAEASEERVVRNEAYQWAVMAAVACLLLGLAVAAFVPGVSDPAVEWGEETAATRRRAGVVAGLCLLWIPSLSGLAVPLESDGPGPAASATAASDVDPPRDRTLSPHWDPAPEMLPPRELYNRALALIDHDFDQAERLLNQARREAGHDGELRYRALYNLGWVEVNRADAALGNDPRQAIQHLHQAVNRFREAIRIRSESQEARQNLEIVSRRLLELTDAVNRRDAGDLAGRLDQLLGQLRGHQRDLQDIARQADRTAEAADTDAVRAVFRQTSAAQRQIIADGQQFYDEGARQLAALRQSPDEEMTVEQRVRRVQLDNLLAFVESGLQRLNQAHSVTRRRQGDRAMRRWSAGLSDFKRARDQLRNPVEVLGQIIPDAAELAGLTHALAEAATRLDADPPPASPPAWLTVDWLQDLQESLMERTRELEQGFEQLAATGTADEAVADSAQTAHSDAPDDRRTRHLLRNVRHALPSITEAAELFGRAAEELAAGALPAAGKCQVEAITALTEAWEWFFDIRRLVEAVYRDQQSVEQALAQLPDTAAGAATLSDTQQTNLDRCARLESLLDVELSQLAAESAESDPAMLQPPAGGPRPEDDPSVLRRRQLELARELLADANRELIQSREHLNQRAQLADQAEEQLEPPSPTDDTTERPLDPHWTAAHQAVQQGLERIEALRRLFFSLVEHLRDTAQRQSNLHDDTVHLRADPPEAWTAERLGPLALRQEQLESMTRQLAEALDRQSEQAVATGATASDAGGVDPDNQPPAMHDTQRLARAAEHVHAAQTAMHGAAQALTTHAENPVEDDGGLEPAIDRQSEALNRLIEALRLLEDSPPSEPPEGPDPSGAGGQDQDAEDADEERTDQQAMSVNQLLQLIRDREAERRKDRKQRAAASRSAVDKDW